MLTQPVSLCVCMCIEEGQGKESGTLGWGEVGSEVPEFVLHVG